MIITRVMSMLRRRHCGKNLDWIAGVVEVVEKEKFLQRHHQDNEIIKHGEDMMTSMDMQIRYT